MIFSVAIYTGETLHDLAPAPGLVRNPVLAAGDVQDIRAEFLADPFMVEVDGTWHMFVETMNADSQLGEIGWATSPDALRWTYERTVLKEEFHLSYPYVFQHEGEWWMVPETGNAGEIRLYRADPFPTRWTLVKTLFEGRWFDASPFQHEGRWYMYGNRTFGVLELMHADRLQGPWELHPCNPLVAGDPHVSRPGGRVIELDGRPVRFTQDCYPDYGMQVFPFEILELTPTAYREQPLGEGPVLRGGTFPWNRVGMHHIDPYRIDGRWLACVDGWYSFPGSE
jgi:hypothetical protein